MTCASARTSRRAQEVSDGTAPGGATGRHQGIEPEIGLVIEGELTVESPMGRQTLRPGSAYWMPSLTPHDVRNESNLPVKVWDIFLKRCD